MIITRRTAGAHYTSVELGSLVEFLDNKRKPVKASERQAGSVPYYGANGIQGYVADHIFDEPLILLAEDGGHFDEPERGIAYEIIGKSWVNNHAHVLRPTDQIDRRFLLWALKHYDVTPYINGSTRSKLTKGQAEKILIPFPEDADEQRRIAAILDKAHDIRRKREKALVLSENLLASLFWESFFGPDANWPTMSLRHVSELINGDRSKNYPSGKDIVKDGVLFLNTKNISESKLKFEQKSFITEQKFQSLARGKLQRGDIVMTLRGTIGQCAIFDGDYQTGFINAQLMIIRPGDRVTSNYLHRLIIHPTTQYRLLRTKTGSAVPQLTAKQIGDLEVPVPPIEAQRRFDDLVCWSHRSYQRIRDTLSSAEDLFSSLSQRAFRGEL